MKDFLALLLVVVELTALLYLLWLILCRMHFDLSVENDQLAVACALGSIATPIFMGLATILLTGDVWQTAVIIAMSWVILTAVSWVAFVLFPRLR